MPAASTTPAARFAIDVQPPWLVGWAALADACALAVFACAPHGRIAAGAALLLHSAAVLPMSLGKSLTGSWRLLAVALCATLPGLGAVVALVMLRAGGGGAPDLLRPPVPKLEDPPVPPPSWKRPLRARLSSKDRGERTSALGELVRRGDAPALAALRAVLARGERDPALEAALAIEEVSARAEQRLSEARLAYQQGPSQASASELLEAIISILEMKLAEAEHRREIFVEAETVIASGWLDRLPAQCRLAWIGRRGQVSTVPEAPPPVDAALAAGSRGAA